MADEARIDINFTSSGPQVSGGAGGKDPDSLLSRAADKLAKAGEDLNRVLHLQRLIFERDIKRSARFLRQTPLGPALPALNLANRARNLGQRARGVGSQVSSLAIQGVQAAGRAGAGGLRGAGNLAGNLASGARNTGSSLISGAKGAMGRGAGMAMSALTSGAVIAASAMGALAAKVGLLTFVTERTIKEFRNRNSLIASASAQREVAQIQSQFVQAARVQSELSNFIAAQSDLQVELREIKTTMLKSVVPLLEVIVRIITALVNVAESIGGQILNFIREGFNALTEALVSIEAFGIGDMFKDVHAWAKASLQKLRGGDNEQRNFAEDMLRKLGDPDFIPNQERDRPPRRF